MSDHEEMPGMQPQRPPDLPPETVIGAPVAPRRRPAAYLAVVIGLVAMGGGAVYFARSFGSADGGGGSTPVAAVQRMFDALGDEDAVGMLESLVPSERDMFLDSVQSITKELGRLGVLRSDLDLGSIQGVDFTFTGLRFTSRQIASGVATVSLQSGTASYKIDPTAPLGDFVRRYLRGTKTIQGSDEAQPDELKLTTIKQGDTWYVSLLYTIAESARTSTGAPPPPFGNGIAARGASSPEKAVEEFLLAAIRLDVRRLIEMTPPVELRALHDYAPLFIDAAEAGAAEVTGGYTAAIQTLDLEADTDGDRSTVVIKEIAFTFTVPDVLGIDYDGSCVSVSGSFFGSNAPQRQCGGGVTSVAGIPGLPQPKIGFVVVRENGSWYVSPTRTVLDGIVGTLKALDRKSLDQLAKLVQAFAGMGG